MHLITDDLYQQLMTLVGTNDAFYFQDFESPIPDSNYKLRIFNYRLASYTDFLNPGAVHCRGVMFGVGKGGTTTLLSLPMEKFWNIDENPMTMGIDLNRINRIEVKADGSLISTYILDDQLFLKSKGSINSTQAVDAMTWLDLPDNAKLKTALYDVARQGMTVNMEWCAPFNRIVLPYQKEHLTVLNIRKHSDGEYVPWENYAELTKHADNVVDVPCPVQFAEHVPDQVGVEGYVYRLTNPYQRVKQKTLWYMTQHRAKDSINSDRRLFETVVADAQDDLRSMFHDDPYVIDRIDWMEAQVGVEYNSMVRDVERFYDENKTLDRKEYAIKGQNELANKMWFPLVMNLYSGKENDYKAFMISKWREYGIKDQRGDGAT